MDNKKKKRIAYTIAFWTIIIVFIVFLLYKFCSNKTIQTFHSEEIHTNSDEFVSGEYIIIGDSNKQEEPLSFVEANSIDYNTIKAVYSSGWVAGGTANRKAMIDSIKDYGFNAVVLDIKDENGHLSYNSSVQIAKDIGSSKNMIKNINEVIKEYHDNGIYVIGRIVTFKDPTFAKAIKDIAYKKDDGSYWTDKSGNYWPNPYNKDSWHYPIELAKEAVELGFDEIQFDYIRFPSSEGRVKLISFGYDSDTISKSQIINEFLTTVMDELSDYKVKISADVFGITTKREGDFEHIGQDYKEIAKIVDVICPMVYPSHYGKGEYGIAKPDLEPYNIVHRAMNDSFERISGDTKTAIVRPYLQDFNASWLGRGNYQIYGNEAVSAQIKACYDLNIHSFTLWDPTNKYCYEALDLANKSGE